MILKESKTGTNKDIFVLYTVYPFVNCVMNIYTKSTAKINSTFVMCTTHL